jgi:hypothetical protein
MKRAVKLSLLCDWERLDTIYYSKEKESSKYNLPGGIILKCNEKGCMTEKRMVEWIRGVWDIKLVLFQSKEKCWYGTLARVM